MKRKRQFRGTSKSRTFFDRKVQCVGYSRQISMGKVIPKDWRYVRIEVMDASENDVVLKIHKLLGADINAQAKGPHKADKPHT